MKILIVSQYFWPETFLINDLAYSLQKRGHQVTILTGKPNYPSGEIFANYAAWGCQNEEQQGVQIKRVPLVPRGKKNKVGLALNYASFIFSASLFGVWQLRQQKFDVTFFFGPSPMTSALPALFLARLKKTPITLWVQDLWPQSLSATGNIKNGLILQSIEKVVRFIYCASDAILVQSPAFISHVKALAGDTPVAYYPNSVATNFLTGPPNEIPDVAGMNAPFPILFTGNIGSAQALHVVLQAAEILKEQKDIAFVLIGDGSLREQLQKEAVVKNLKNVYFPGSYPVETMLYLMQKAQVLLVTLANEEIFSATIPSKIQSYMAAGRPIIACLNGEGARLVTEAGAGLTVPAENGRALADAALQMYQMDQNQRSNMAKNAHHYYLAHFEHNQLVDKLINHFEALIRKK